MTGMPRYSIRASGRHLLFLQGMEIRGWGGAGWGDSERREEFKKSGDLK